MEHPVASQAHYAEHQRQMAWINTENWQFERPEKRYRVRHSVARALIQLAMLLTPVRREARTT